MKTRIALALVFAPLSFLPLGCPANDGELRPILQELFLPASLARCNPDAADGAIEALCGAADQCTRFNQVFLCEEPSAQPVQSFSVRNIGTSKITIEKVEFTGEDAASFTEPVFDTLELFGDDVASLAFNYLTPDIEQGYSANLVITSDAAVNPELSVPVSTLPFVDLAAGEGEGE